MNHHPTGIGTQGILPKQLAIDHQRKFGFLVLVLFNDFGVAKSLTRLHHVLYFCLVLWFGFLVLVFLTLLRSQRVEQGHIFFTLLFLFNHVF
jgi:hypothetical protein